MILLTPAYGRMRADSDGHAALPMPDFSADADTDSVDNRQQLGELLQSISETVELTASDKPRPWQTLPAPAPYPPATPAAHDSTRQ